MTRAEIRDALLASYQSQGGINHLDGVNLPSQDSVNMLARDCMHLLFPGYFEASAIEKSVVPVHIDGLLGKIDQRLRTEVEKCLRFAEHASPAKRAVEIAGQALEQFPDLRRLIQTDVAAAFEGDPAARSLEEIILAYPCVLVISLQRVAHVLYHLQVPLLPRMLTEFGHERTGADIHPGARLGTHFFIDHCTGVVVGETTTIGNHVKLYQGVTLGAKSFETDEQKRPVKGVKRHPDIEDHVTIYPGATILGGGTVIGRNSVIGSHVWLMKSVPPESVVYYHGELTSIVREQRNAPKGQKAAPVSIEQGDWTI
ncbi:MAG TPA: serine O-acetyltransferase [Opitutaceae bacterium]|jgi:serine O-acetyltransferase|nr:serine O-acetyltransferase [Opitutaceae bacterium]